MTPDQALDCTPDAVYVNGFARLMFPTVSGYRYSDGMVCLVCEAIVDLETPPRRRFSSSYDHPDEFVVVAGRKALKFLGFHTPSWRDRRVGGLQCVGVSVFLMEFVGPLELVDAG